MASSNQNPNVKEIPSSSSICVKSPSIIRTVSSPGRMIWLRKSAAVLRRHWRNSLTSAALPLLREYDCHERVPVDLDAERDGVRRNRRESMSRAKTLVTGATGMTGSHTVQLLLKRGHTVRVLAHNEDDRSMRLQELGAEVVIGDLLNLNDVRLALRGIRGAYLVYPLSPTLVQATAIFAQAPKKPKSKSWRTCHSGTHARA